MWINSYNCMLAARLWIFGKSETWNSKKRPRVLCLVWSLTSPCVSVRNSVPSCCCCMCSEYCCCWTRCKDSSNSCLEEKRPVVQRKRERKKTDNKKEQKSLKVYKERNIRLTEEILHHERYSLQKWCRSSSVNSRKVFGRLNKGGLSKATSRIGDNKS